MEKVKKQDRRINKTKNSIRSVVITLIQKKDISQITVKELAETADINRKTFYMHYSSIEEVLDQIENEIIEKLLNLLNKYDFFEDKFDGSAFFSSLNDVISEDFDLYKKLICANSYNFLLVKVKKILKDIIMERLDNKVNDSSEMLNLYAEFISSGVMNMYIDWFTTNSDIPLEELTKAASKISFTGINSILK
ncbi:MAG: TetR/AcrR family transcriptional regulator C-terminal domain-containing protein [Clostridium sp.]|nr:TetR/AcrR family transcriptional regulator C-terminal domain-containing protein [Clostridium sp.]